LALRSLGRAVDEANGRGAVCVRIVEASLVPLNALG
jgi:hypothetical protein